MLCWLCNEFSSICRSSLCHVSIKTLNKKWQISLIALKILIPINNLPCASPTPPQSSSFSPSPASANKPWAWKMRNPHVHIRVVVLLAVPPHFQHQNEEKNLAQPTRSYFILQVFRQSSSGWLQLFFHFGTEYWEEKLKKHTEDFFCKNDTFTRHECTKN